MANFYKVTRKNEADMVANNLRSIGYNIKVLPYREGGLNQPMFRTIQLNNPGSLADQLRRQKKYRELKIDWVQS